MFQFIFNIVPNYFLFNVINQDVIAGLGNRFAIVIIAIVIALISRFILMRLMNRWMMAKSKKAESIHDDVISETTHNKDIAFNMLDSNSDFSDTSVHRETLVERAKKSMGRQFKLDLLIVLIYIAAGLYVYGDALLGFESYRLITGYDDVDFYFETLKRALPYFLYVILFLIWVVMRYIGFRNQFKAYQKGIFGLISPLWKFVFAIFQSRWYMLLALVVMVMTLFKGVFSILFGIKAEGFVFLFAVGFHFVMIYRTRQSARQRPNLKLLILRVFLINKTSLFTFSRLAKFWKHFGSYFTVADPSFYRVFWKRKFNHKFPVFIVFLFLLYTQLENAMRDSGSGSPFIPFMVLLFLGAFIFIIYSIRRMKLNFVSHKSALDKTLLNLEKHPVKLDNTFKEKPMSCYDNTWKITVEKLVVTANVVLMDLRGFSEKNKGCEYEVNLLLNSVSLDKILFLGYPSAIPLIKEVIKRKFETLEANSPNKTHENPMASIFEVHEESNKETQHIMDALIEKAIRD